MLHVLILLVIKTFKKHKDFRGFYFDQDVERLLKLTVFVMQHMQKLVVALVFDRVFRRANIFLLLNFEFHKFDKRVNVN